MDDFLRPRPKKRPTPQKETIIKPETGDTDKTVAEIPLAEPPKADTVEEVSTSTQSDKVKKKFWRKRHPIGWFKSLQKKQKALVVLAVLLLFGGGVAGAWYLLKPKPQPKPVAKVVAPKPVAPKPETEPSRLTGVQVKPELNQRPVTAIMIENSPDARPQSGLKEAGVVFEAIAEGGITRFLALFQEAQPANIGPVRSVRPYYVDWLHGFDAAVAHVGGSSDGLAKIKADGIKDLDQFANPKPYHRISSRYAPHNMYTSMAGLDELSKSKGFTSSKFDGFPRKDEKKLDTPTVTSMDFNISGYLYNPHYDYDATTNVYKRSEGGKPHIDAESGDQLAPKVVIVVVIPYGIAANGVNSQYGNIGTGKAIVFQDGGKTEGTWSKSSGSDQIKFNDANGQPIKLNPGQTWISVVGSADRVSYK